MKIRRKTLYVVLQSAAIGLAVLDLVVYLGVSRPLAAVVDHQHNRVSVARQYVRAAQARIAQDQRELTQLPETEEAMKGFLDKHVPPRKRSYSRAAGLVHKLTQDNGVQLEQVAYRLDSNPKDPLQRLGISVRVQGSFESLEKFEHAMETSDEFLKVRGAIIQPGENGGLGLRLIAELYVSP